MSCNLALRGLGGIRSPVMNINDRLLRPRTIVGRHPDTGVIHRLKITTQDRIIIERQPYVSDCVDGWTQTYHTVEDEADKHLFLILKIEQNPCEWPS